MCNMPKPRDVQAVQRFVNPVKYLSRFLQNLSDMSEPLGRLTNRRLELTLLISRPKPLQTLTKQFQQLLSITLSVPVVLLNSPNLSPYFSLNKFERILLLIFNSLLCLVNSHLLITKCFILYLLCKEKLADNK